MVKLQLEDILKQSKVSKRRFAKMLGIEYANVFRYFRKGYDPKLSTLEQWAEVLEVRIRDLFEDSAPFERKKTK